MIDDLNNRKLLIGTAISLGLSCAVVAILLAANVPWTRPGGVFGQSIAIIGSCALLLSALSALLKHAAIPARHNFSRHIWLACIGFVLVAAHSRGNLLAAPALLLLALVALMALGIWARTSGAQRMAATFGSKPGALSAYDPAIREQLKALISRKQAMLITIDADASEATFSLRPAHWLRSPLKSLAYRRLVHQERSLIGTDRSVGMAQAYWRRIHRLIAVLFIVGLLVHVILVTFFAGYVAEGREIYWWHLAAWDL